MAYHEETGSGSARATNYRDLLGKTVRFLTSRHIATVAVNAGGSGYAVGDTLTINDSVFTNAQHLEAVFEVTSVSAGVITGLRINASGAYAQQAASATIGAGGTGYQVGDLLQVQGGSSRLPAKARVTTVSAGAVTAVAFAEATAGDGSEPGVYATTPGNPAATVGVGNVASGTTYAGDDACTLTVTYSPIPTTLTNRPTNTSGGGTGATVDVTFAETGWAVDGRDDHEITVNSITNERNVVLKGDASGLNNKPFVGFITGSATSGLNTRYAVAVFGLIAHNPALAFSAQGFLSPSWDGSSLADGGSYWICSQDTGSGVSAMDFWLKADDTHVAGISQLDQNAAVSDNGQYVQMYAGLMDRIGTETEDPYPALVFASSRAINVDPTAANSNVTSIAEQRHTGNGPGWFWHNASGSWLQIQNDDVSGAPTFEEHVMLPVGQPRVNVDVNQAVLDGAIAISPAFFKLDRSSATLILRKIPGTASEFFLWPLSLARKPAQASDAVNDRLHGQVKGIFWISSDDGTGTRITNFSEDYVTIAGVRYKVFHNHVHTDPYQYIAFKQDT